jgi:hypothetical protein
MMTDTVSPSESTLRNAVAGFTAKAGLQDCKFDDAGQLHFDMAQIAFTFSLISEPAPALWVACDLGPVAGDNPVVLRWLLRESFEPWAHARINIGFDAARQHAVAACVLAGELVDPDFLTSIVALMIDATASARDHIARHDIPDILGDHSDAQFDAMRL